MSSAIVDVSPLQDTILTAVEVALELRCSKAQVHKLINGQVKGSPKLRAIFIGRKRVIRRSSLEDWKRESEGLASPKNDAA
jgi:hypothetical protein